VIDDDPTGRRRCKLPLLLRWDRPTLLPALRDPSPLVFPAWADTRALGPGGGAPGLLPVCGPETGPGEAVWSSGLPGEPAVLTLRGHFPAGGGGDEQSFAPFRCTLLVPAFVEGGRQRTVEGVHCCAVTGAPIPLPPTAASATPPAFLPDCGSQSGGRRKAAQWAGSALPEL